MEGFFSFVKIKMVVLAEHEYLLNGHTDVDAENRQY